MTTAHCFAQRQAGLDKTSAESDSHNVLGITEMSKPGTPSSIVEKTFAAVGFFFGIASLLNYYEVFADQGIYAVLEALVTRYREVVHAVFGFLDRPLEALAAFIAQRLQLHLELQPYWKDVFVPIGLYFANSARATHGANRAAYRYALFACGLIVALFFSMVLASLGAELRLIPALVTLTSGVVVYELFSYALLLLLVQQADRTSSPGFWRYVLERPLSSIALGMLATGAASLAFADSANTAAFALILFILLLGLRSMMLAIMFAAENRGGWPGNFRERLFRSRSWILGVFVVVSIVVATLGVAWGG